MPVPAHQWGFFACVERSTATSSSSFRLPVSPSLSFWPRYPVCSNGKVFRECVALPALDEVEWSASSPRRKASLAADTFARFRLTGFELALR